MDDRFKRIEHMLNGVRCGTIGTITATERIIEMFNSDGGYAVLGDGWRDASKILPDGSGYYICHSGIDIYLPYIAMWDSDDKQWRTNGERTFARYWRPLPDPPAFAEHIANMRNFEEATE